MTGSVAYFFSQLGTIISQWWTFLCSTYVPSTNFTFGALILFVLAFNTVIFIIELALHFRPDLQRGDKKK